MLETAGGELAGVPSDPGVGVVISPDFGDRTDFENAERGRVDSLDPCVVKAADGRVVWDLEAYSYLDADCPDSVNEMGCRKRWPVRCP